MAKSEYEKRMVAAQRRVVSQQKMLRVFSVAIPQLGKVLDAGNLLTEDRGECTYAQNQLHKIVVRVSKEGWPTVNVAEFLSLKSPKYQIQIDVFHRMEIRTLIRFFRSPLAMVKVAFAERGLKLPVVFEILHLEYNQQ